MAKIEIIISDDTGTILSMFDLTEAFAVGEVTDINLADEIKDILSCKYNIIEK